ncbi:MAG: PAS domain-containing protein [Sulfurovum sp.]
MLIIKDQGKEKKLSSDDILVSKTDISGRITYGNETFLKVAGYTKEELIGQPHNIIRHPDMPKAIFQLMWESIKKGKNITAVVKNLTKDGKFYWVTTDFDIQRGSNGQIRNYIAFREATPRKVIKEVEKIYAILLDIEKKKGDRQSMEFLNIFLEDKQMTYNEYIQDLARPKGIGQKLLHNMKSFC